MKVIDLKGTFPLQHWLFEGKVEMEISIVTKNIAYFQAETDTTTLIQFVGIDPVFTAYINSKDLKNLISK